MSEPTQESTAVIGLTPPPARRAPKAKRRLPVWAWVLIGIGAFGLGVLLSPIFVVIFLIVLVTGIVALAKNTPTWLRLRDRKVAIWVTAVSAVGLLITGSLANVVLAGATDDEPVAFSAGSSAESTQSPAPPSPTPTPTTASAVTLLSVVDGDTIDTSAGEVRLIGIDTPEIGLWGYDQASAELAAFLGGGTLTLVAVDGRDDSDQYGRLLRYVRVGGQDAGSHMIETGWAVARYDSRDGYGAHPLESEYVTLDAQHDMPSEPAPAPVAPAPAPVAPAPVAPAPAEPAQPVAPATDPQFRTCRDANQAGYGNYQQGVDPEYNWYQDRDHDGWVCEF
ncbi:thermonuclease family protein [Microbacterium ulmi]|uniref:Thermonuclease family protein n=1 Tax=Microbacterium ulmi TaxID=179095 RepID=A0A7Y2LYF5_9MICO|nr:thermonuclease family protein [Microbacterium ulmi]NII71147.1 endonuclease YncB(thermonuclease family) [Microbacterium ulmi]NNH02454.1 thermonuclease family protein [Microbacterium ulmi]